MWRTPQSCNANQGPKSEEHYKRCLETNESMITLTDQVRHAGMWPTPRANKPEGYSSAEFRPTLAQTATGKEKPLHGQLNPAWVEQLMGFPVGWTDSDCDNPEATPFPAPLGCDQYPWEQPRVATGIKERTNRLKALGNAVVPQIPFIIGSCILEIEGGDNS